MYYDYHVVHVMLQIPLQFEIWCVHLIGHCYGYSAKSINPHTKNIYSNYYDFSMHTFLCILTSPQSLCTVLKFCWSDLWEETWAYIEISMANEINNNKYSRWWVKLLYYKPIHACIHKLAVKWMAKAHGYKRTFLPQYLSTCKRMNINVANATSPHYPKQTKTKKTTGSRE